eukprot:4354456-Lingulodinium_polyedra.AAC.1
MTAAAQGGVPEAERRPSCAIGTPGFGMPRVRPTRAAAPSMAALRSAPGVPTLPAVTGPLVGLPVTGGGPGMARRRGRRP